jgi:hypothetical protein
VLCLEHGRVAEIAAFEQPSMFTAFGLPASLLPATNPEHATTLTTGNRPDGAPAPGVTGAATSLAAGDCAPSR